MISTGWDPQADRGGIPLDPVVPSAKPKYPPKPWEQPEAGAEAAPAQPRSGIFSGGIPMPPPPRAAPEKPKGLGGISFKPESPMPAVRDSMRTAERDYAAGGFGDLATQMDAMPDEARRLVQTDIAIGQRPDLSRPAVEAAVFESGNQKTRKPFGTEPEGAMMSGVRAGLNELAPAIGQAIGSVQGALRGGPAGYVAGGVAGRAAVSKLQTELMESLIGQEGMEQWRNQMVLNAKAHPIASGAGSMLGNLPALVGGGTKVVPQTGLRRIAADAQKFATLGMGGTVQRKIEGMPGAEEESIIGSGVRGAVSGAAMGSANQVLERFVPLARTYLGSIFIKAPSDALVLETANSLYETAVNGKPFEPHEMLKNTAMNLPSFMAMNAIMGASSGFNRWYGTKGQAGKTSQQRMAEAAKAANGIEQLVKDARSYAKANNGRISPEAMVLMQGVDPAVAGTTPQRVAKMAQKYGIPYDPTIQAKPEPPPAQAKAADGSTPAKPGKGPVSAAQPPTPAPAPVQVPVQYGDEADRANAAAIDEIAAGIEAELAGGEQTGPDLAAQNSLIRVEQPGEVPAVSPIEADLSPVRQQKTSADATRETTKTGIQIDSKWHNTIGSAPPINPPNGLPIENGYAYRVVSANEVDSLNREGILIPDPSAQGMEKKSRRQPDQKMWSVAASNVKAAIGTPNIVMRIPLDRLPVDQGGKLAKAEDIEILQWSDSQKAWVPYAPPPLSAPAVPLAMPDQPQPAPAREAVSGPEGGASRPDAMPPISPGAGPFSAPVAPQQESGVRSQKSEGNPPAEVAPESPVARPAAEPAQGAGAAEIVGGTRGQAAEAALPAKRPNAAAVRKMTRKQAVALATAEGVRGPNEGAGDPWTGYTAKDVQDRILKARKGAEQPRPAAAVPVKPVPTGGKPFTTEAQSPNRATTVYKFPTKKAAQRWVDENGVSGKLEQAEKVFGVAPMFYLEVDAEAAQGKPAPGGWYKDVNDNPVWLTQDSKEIGFGPRGPYSWEDVRPETGESERDILKRQLASTEEEYRRTAATHPMAKTIPPVSLTKAQRPQRAEEKPPELMTPEDVSNIVSSWNLPQGTPRPYLARGGNIAFSRMPREKWNAIEKTAADNGWMLSGGAEFPDGSVQFQLRRVSTKAEPAPAAEKPAPLRKGQSVRYKGEDYFVSGMPRLLKKQGIVEITRKGGGEPKAVRAELLEVVDAEARVKQLREQAAQVLVDTRGFDPADAADYATKLGNEKELEGFLADNTPEALAELEKESSTVEAKPQGVEAGSGREVAEKVSEDFARNLYVLAGNKGLDTYGIMQASKDRSVFEAGGNLAEWVRRLSNAARKAGLTNKEIIQASKTAFQTPNVVQPAEDLEPAAEPAADPHFRLADRVTALLARGESLDNPKLTELANEIFGGTRGEGKYDPRDMYDAMEAGVNRYVESSGMVKFDDPEGTMQRLVAFEKRLARQADRTKEQIQLQQFSTPPAEAFAVVYGAGIRPGMTVVEPSAGTANIAIMARIAGARVIANEISERRANLLRHLGFEIYSVNAEQLDNLLPADIQPDIIAMNPPFSSTGGRTSFNDTKFGARHITQALSRLKDGGRLVAIVGRGMAHERPNFSSWWEGIEKRYTVRFNVGIDGKNYQKYGTGFDNQILVIDKTGPTPGVDRAERLGYIIRGEGMSPAETIEKLKPLSEENINERLIANRDRQPIETGAASGVRDGAAPAAVRGAGTGRGGAGRPRAAGGREQGAGQLPGTVGERAGDDAGTRQPDDAERGIEPVAAGEPDRGEPAGVGGPSGVAGDEFVSAAGRTAGSGVAGKEEEGTPYSTYQVQKAVFDHTRTHPADIVESTTMAAVEHPDATYSPKIPTATVREGRLSDVQMEAITYAGQRHAKQLVDEKAAGYWIGDGTGVGKGREIAGVILDNWQQGRKRAVWISFDDSKLDVQAEEDLRDIGFQGKFHRQKDHSDKKSLPNEDGVLFTAYSKLRAGWKSAGGNGGARFKQIADWLGADFDGVIVFDEAHKMKNALAGVSESGGKGRGGGTDTGAAGLKLQEAFPKAKILYVSATGATTPRNMGYLARMGLWGKGAPFPDFQAFLGAMHQGGVGMMEMLSRDLKSIGAYISRSISFKGVEYDKVEHVLTPDEEQMYNRAADVWATLVQKFEEAAENGGATKKEYVHAFSQIYSSQQRFFLQLMTATQLPDALKAADLDLAEGRQVVISVFNTGEAAAKEAMRDAKAEGKEADVDDFDFTPRQMMAQLVEKYFPVEQWEEKTDPATGKTTRVQIMVDGKPLINRENVQMRDEMLELIGTIRLPDNPMDAVVNHFGPKIVAEISGRKKRVEGKRIVTRKMPGVSAKDLNKSEQKAFQEGRKKVAIISGAASTGISLHADKKLGNKSRRVLYALQLSWSADEQMQTFGRVHRSFQAEPPQIKLVHTNVAGQQRLVNTVSRRLASLGALTKGGRETLGGSLFNIEDLTDDNGISALDKTWVWLKREHFDWLKRMGVLNKDNNVKDSFYEDVEKFLNRIMVLPVKNQNEAFKKFYDEFTRILNAARESGLVDSGVETLKADNLRQIGNPETVYTHEASGAQTKIVLLEGEVKVRRMTFRDAERMIKDSDFDQVERLGFYKNIRSGKVYAALRRTNYNSGAREAILYNQRGDRHSVSPWDLQDSDKYEELEKGADKAAWDAELAKVPVSETRKFPMLTGAVIPIYDKVFTNEDMRLRAVRAKLKDGRQHLGMVLPEDQIEGLKVRLGIGSDLANADGKTIYDVVASGAIVELDNGWMLRMKRVHGENRMELDWQGKYPSEGELDDYGLIAERIEYKNRWFVPLDSETGPEAISKLIRIHKAVRTADSGSTGERFAAAGLLARTADIGQHQEAKRMEQAGQSREAIWRKTGWWKGPDGQWRFEVDDSKMRMKISDAAEIANRAQAADPQKTFADMGISDGVPLAEVIDHPDLFNAYPSMRDVVVYPTRNGNSGEFSQRGNSIGWSTRIFGDIAKSTLLHEIQHYIQYAENFATGNSLDSIGRERSWELDERRRRAWEKVAEFRKAYPQVLVAFERMRDLNKLLAEKHGIDRVNLDGSLVAGYQRKLQKALFPRDLELRREAQAEYNAAIDQAGGFEDPGIRGFLDAANDLWKTENESTGDLRNFYLRTAGEVESRFVQRRLDLPPMQRQAIPPWQTMETMLREEGLLEPGQKPEDALIFRKGLAGSPAESRMEAEYGPEGENESGMASGTAGRRIPGERSADDAGRNAARLRDGDRRGGQLPREERGGIQAPVGSRREVVATAAEAADIIRRLRWGSHGVMYEQTVPDDARADLPEAQAATGILEAAGVKKVAFVRGLYADATTAPDGSVLISDSCPLESLPGLANHEKVHLRVAAGDTDAVRLVKMFQSSTKAAMLVQQRLTRALQPAIGFPKASLYAEQHAAEETAAMLVDYATPVGGRTALGASFQNLLSAYGGLAKQAETLARKIAAEGMAQLGTINVRKEERFAAIPPSGTEYDGATVAAPDPKRGGKTWRIVGADGKTIEGGFLSKETAETVLAERSARLGEAMEEIAKENKATVAKIAAARGRVVAALSAQKVKRDEGIAAVMAYLDALKLPKELYGRIRYKLKAIVQAEGMEKIEGATARAIRFADETLTEAAGQLYLKKLNDVLTKKRTIITETGILKAQPRHAAVSGPILEKALAMSQMKPEKVNARMDELDALFEQAERAENPDMPAPTMEQVHERHLLSVFGGLAHQADYRRARSALDAAERIIRDGATAFMMEEGERQARAEELRTAAIAELKAGREAPANAYARAGQGRSFGQQVAEAARGFWMGHEGGSTFWNQLDNRRGVADKSGRLMEFHGMETAGQNDEFARNERVDADLHAAIARATGIDGMAGRSEAKALRKVLNGWKAVQERSGVFVRTVERDEQGNVTGIRKGEELKNGRTSLLYVWLIAKRAEAAAMQPFNDAPAEIDGADTSIMRSLVENGYTAETIREIEANVGPRLLDFGRWMVEYLDRYSAPEVRRVTERLFGAVPPIEAGYFPIRREHYGRDEDAASLSASGGGVSMARSWMKLRVPNLRDLRESDAIEVFMRHLREVNHVSTHLETVDLENRVMKNQQMQKALAQILGERARRHVNGHVNVLTTGGVPELFDGGFNQIMRKFARSVIPSPTVMLKQTTSYPLMASFLPPGYGTARWMADVARMHNPMAQREWNARFNREFGYWRQRFGEGWNLQMRIAMKKEGMAAIDQKADAFQVMSNFIRWGDKVACLTGGVGVFKAWRDHFQTQGMAPAAAERAAYAKLQAAIEESQQSGALKDMGTVQTNPMMRMFMMFKTQPLAISRLYMNAIRGIAYQRGDAKSHWRTIAAIHLSQALFQFVADAFWAAALDDDDEWKRLAKNQLRAQLLAPINGYFMLYDAAALALNKAMRAPVYGDFGSDILPWTSVAESAGQAIGRTSRMMTDGIQDGDWWMLSQALGEGAGVALGQPIAPVMRIGEGLVDAATDDSLNPVARPLRAIGYGKAATGQDRGGGIEGFPPPGPRTWLGSPYKR